MLFDELTVEEHLRFFSLLKGMDKSLVEKEVNRMIGALGLENKRHAQSHTLSGGMKRKLSVGIAFCGGSKVIYIPTPRAFRIFFHELLCQLCFFCEAAEYNIMFILKMLKLFVCFIRLFYLMSQVVEWTLVPEGQFGT